MKKLISKDNLFVLGMLTALSGVFIHWSLCVIGITVSCIIIFPIVFKMSDEEFYDFMRKLN